MLKRELVAEVRPGIYSITADGLLQIALLKHETDLKTHQTDPDRSTLALDRPDWVDRIEKTGTENQNIEKTNQSARSERKTPDLDTFETNLDTDLPDLDTHDRPDPKQLAFIPPPTRYE